MKLHLIATTTFGLEAVVRREIEALGMRVEKTENGKVTFLGDERAVVRANLWLRCADRVMIRMAEFDAVESEDLYQQVMAIPWENYILPDDKFTVHVSTVKSHLRSEPINQKTVKKAIIVRLGQIYGIDWFPETGPLHDIYVSLLKDRVTISMDTSGAGLHKRGYREHSVKAPIKETLASAMVQLSFWNPDRLLLDPCCGSGTIAIEAAMIGRNIAPGLDREFAAEHWEFIDPQLWKEERRAAYAAIDYDRKMQLAVSDIDPKALHAAALNAENAGVEDCIVFKRCDIADCLKTLESARIMAVDGFPEGAVVISNLPYGVRIADNKALLHIYETLEVWLRDRKASFYFITPEKKFEKLLQRQADRRRKLYNGNIETTYFQFYGERPSRRD
ncbi:MAG: class I SAM-dependent RNA methyltransferase [Eubacterium sp.]|nr:class I SAM-dependent RNA methyltransferase [Eubacterium sp.]